MSARFGPFLLVEELGRGAFGSVWLAKPDEGLGFPTPVVIKRLHESLSVDPGFVARFEHEAAWARHVHSPHVVQILDSGAEQGSLFLAMEYVEGWPLSRVIGDLTVSRERLEVRTAVALTEGILKGLSALHSAKSGDGEALGGVHRDLAPKNVMVGLDGRAKIIDLGLAKSKLSNWSTQTGAVMGSPGYMAPEQALGRDTDLRTDLYAAGVILFELLTLEPYVRRGPLAAMIANSARPVFRKPSSMRTGIPKRLDEVLRSALDPDLRFRFDSADSFLAALNSAAPFANHAAPLEALVQDMLSLNVERTRIHVRKALATVDSTPPAPPEPAPTDPPTDSATMIRRPRRHVPIDPPRVRPNVAVYPTAPRKEPGKLALSIGAIVVVAFLGGSGVRALMNAGPRVAAPPLIVPRPARGPEVSKAVEERATAQPPKVAVAEAMLAVESVPDGALVLDSGEPLGRTPLTIRLRPGDHNLTVERPGFEPIQQLVKLEAGAMTKLPFTLRRVRPEASTQVREEARPPPPSKTLRGSGYVTLDTRPWTEVSIDGVASGSTPLFQLPVSPGTHVFRVRNVEAGIDEIRSVTVVDGKTAKLKWDLKAPSPLKAPEHN